MYHNQPSGQMGGSPLTKCIDACAFVLSLTLTFFATPPAYSASAPFISAYVAKHYAIQEASNLATVVSVSWWALVLTIIFVTSRLIASVLLLSLSSKTFSRFL